MKRKQICLLHVPVFDPDRAIGGAEVIAVDVVRWLSAENDVTVLHGFLGTPGNRAYPDYPGEIMPGFRLSDHGFQQLGHIRPDFTDAARQKLAAADIIMSVESSLDSATSAARVVLMGGVGYPHTHDIMRRRAWDRLVVPSALVARQVSEAVQGNPKVTVIENGVDLDLFSPVAAGAGQGASVAQRAPAHTTMHLAGGPGDVKSGARGSTDLADRPGAADLAAGRAECRGLRLLIPSRPTLDKGFVRAAELTRALDAAGYPATLVIFEQPDGFSPEGVGGLIGSAGCTVEVLPWQPRPAMPGTYRDADLTLCLGTAVEGFGLVAAESVACGTPVLSHSGGFLKEMLPTGHGLYHADPAAAPDLLAEEALAAIRDGRRLCLNYGRPYIENRYSLRRMGEQFSALVRGL